jgi:hypothetical protein
VLTVRALVTLCQTEVNNVDGILSVFVASNQKVVRFDVSVNDSLLMNNLDSLDHLHGDVQHTLEVELLSALLEQVL